ncbi:MAG TPA: fused MFS/spermidine synthase [Verrucomicrobiae bacterium]
MSGLIYEVAWVRSLELIFGATTFAIATVLAAFMGGLAFGSFSIGRIAHKFRASHPLKIYAAIELLIAATGVVIPLCFGALTPLYQFIWRATHASFFTFSVLRFGLSALVLIIPTFLMGATLPVVSAYVNRIPALGKRRIGLLYSFNTAGAVLGCLAAGLWLFPTIGLQKTQWVAIAFNLIAALGGFLLARESWASEPASNNAEAPASQASPAPKANDGQANILVLVYALSGTIAMLYEVAWSRVLVLVLGSSTYACTIMLATFLLGLALGAAAAARFKLQRPLLAAAVCQILIGAATLLGVTLVEEIPWLYVRTTEALQPGVHGLLGLQIAFSAALMILPTIGLGAMFPIALQGLRTTAANTSRTIGWAYGLNTLGAIVGSVAAGFWLVPFFGCQNTLTTGIAANFALGLIALALAKGLPVPRLRPALAALVLLLCTQMFVFQSRWDPAILSTGVFRYARTFFGLSRETFRERAHSMAGEVLQFKEGLTCTVTVLRNPECVSLMVNGKPDASTPSGLNPESNLTGLAALHDLPTQILLGEAPLLLAPKREQILVVGLGSGVTVGSVLQHPVKEVECVELENAVVQGSRFFEDYNGRPLSDPRVKLIVNDARNHLLVTDKHYDVIISEPSNPWIPGAANLFTKDFFELAARKLSTEGIFCQWIQLYELQEEHFQTILRTFSTVFPEAHLFRVKQDAILIGAKGPIPLNLSSLQSRWTALVRADLARVHVHSIQEWLAWYWIGSAELHGNILNARINTDDNMLIEFAAPLQVLASHSAGVERNLTELFPLSTGALAHLQLAPGMDAHQFWSETARAALNLNALPLATNYAAASWRIQPNPSAAAVLAVAEIHLNHPTEAQRILHDAAFGAAPEILRAQAQLCSLQTRWRQAAEFAERLLETEPGDATGEFYLGRALFHLGDYKASAEAFGKISLEQASEETVRELPFFLGSIALSEKNYREAARNYRQFLRYYPAHVEGRTLLADALYHDGQFAEAAEQWQTIARFNSSKVKHLLDQAIAESQSGHKDEAVRLLSEAHKTDGSNIEVVLLLAREKQNASDNSGAIALLEDYLAQHPNRPDAVGYLSQFLKDEKKIPEARVQSARYRALTGHDWEEIR